VTIKGVDDNPGIAGTGMKNVFTDIWPCADRSVAADPCACIRHSRLPLQDKPFAEHKIVLQLFGQRSERSRASSSASPTNLMKFYDPRQGRDRGGGVRSPASIC